MAFGAAAALGPFHHSLRKKDIFNAHLVCHHYRIASRESCESKARGEMVFYKIDPKAVLMADHAEILDETMVHKWQRHLAGLPDSLMEACHGRAVPDCRGLLHKH